MRTIFTILFLFLLVYTSFAQTNERVEWYLQRPDTDIYVREAGRGKDAVIVVHGGFGANHDYMLDAVRGTEDEHHFVFYDQRGSLLSPTAKENLTFDKNVEDLAALVRALRRPRVKLFCHSMGTLVCMEFMKRHPNKVSAMVLAGAIFAKADSEKDVFSPRMERQVAELLNRPEVTKLLKPYLDKGLEKLRTVEDIDASRLTHKDLTDAWRIKFAATNIFDITRYARVKGGRAFYKPEAAVMSETVNWKYDYRPILAANKNVTFIQGDRDFLDFDAAEHRKLLEPFPKIRLVVIKNAGHNAWIDAPQQFGRLLNTALGSE